MDSRIRIYMTAACSEALGPCQRFVVWVQGCSKRCAGCISPDAQPMDGGEWMNTANLAEEICSAPGIEGITISGGEPFLQQDALCELIDRIRKERDLGVIVYTGRRYSEIRETPLAQRCDLIIDGEYVDALNDDGSLRGSSNQKAICVTGRYTQYVQQCFGRPGRKVEFVVGDRQVDMIGIPTKRLLADMRNSV